MEPIVAALQKVGFSQYEAQAYVGLLQHAPVTGYELSKRSGVPRSMIYEVLGKLQDRGAVHLVPAEQTMYTPVAAKDLISRLRQHSEQTLHALEESLTSLETPQEPEMIRHIRGYDPVVDEALALLERARRSLWVSIWHAEISSLTASTQEQPRNLSIASACWDETEGNIGDGLPFYREHLPPRTPGSRQRSDLHIIVRDDEEVIIANFSSGSRPWAILTQDRALVFLAKQLLQHNTAFAIVRQHADAHLKEALARHPYLKNMLAMESRNADTAASRPASDE